jgi:hypothetical protein
MVEENVEKKEVAQEGQVSKAGRSSTQKPNDLARKLDVIGWGLFFIWLGIVMIIPWKGNQVNVALLGIGIIILGMQVARLVVSLKMERFWLVVGLLFIVISLWELANPGVHLIPILLIAAGVALVLTRFFPRQQKQEE